MNDAKRRSTNTRGRERRVRCDQPTKGAEDDDDDDAWHRPWRGAAPRQRHVRPGRARTSHRWTHPLACQPRAEREMRAGSFFHSCHRGGACLIGTWGGCDALFVCPTLSKASERNPEGRGTREKRTGQKKMTRRTSKSLARSLILRFACVVAMVKPRAHLALALCPLHPCVPSGCSAQVQKRKPAWEATRG